MATLKVSAAFQYTDGSDKVPNTQLSFTETPAGTARVDKRITVGTVDENIDLADVGTIGKVIVMNLDDTNYVLAGGDGTNYFDKIPAGQFMVKHWNGAALHLKANTAACECRVIIFSA